MPHEIIHVPGIADPVLPLSHAVRVGPFLFVSGQASVDEQGQIVADSFEGEMRRTMENIKRVLAAAGMTLADVVQVRSYVDDRANLSEYNHLYREYFPNNFPARTTIMNCLADVVKFEMDVVAHKES